MKFAAVVSPFDCAWMFGAWGKPAVYWWLDRLSWAGVSKVYLRVRQCQCYYPSRVDMPGIHFWSPKNCVAERSWGTQGHEWKWWPEAYDFRTYDAPRLFIDRAHELGMEIYAWLEQAEAHGHGWESRFSHEHPELLTRNRDGQVVGGNLSFGYPEAVEFKLALLREILEYRFDGVALDFQKGGDHRIPRVDLDGVYYAHYDLPIVEAFRAATSRDPFAIPNSDPGWLRFRAEYVTGFMREARALQRRLHPEQDFGVMGIPTGKPLPARSRTPAATHSEASSRSVPAAGALEGNLEDQAAWTREGLVDFLVTTPLPQQMSPTDPEGYRAVLRDARSRITAPCRFGLWQVTWNASAEQVRQIVRAAATWGAEEGVEETVFFQAEAFQDAQGASRNLASVDREASGEVTWNALRQTIREVTP